MLKFLHKLEEKLEYLDNELPLVTYLIILIILWTTFIGLAIVL